MQRRKGICTYTGIDGLITCQCSMSTDKQYQQNTNRLAWGLDGPCMHGAEEAEVVRENDMVKHEAHNDTWGIILCDRWLWSRVKWLMDVKERVRRDMAITKLVGDKIWKDTNRMYG